MTISARIIIPILLIAASFGARAQYAGLPLVDTPEVRQPGEVYLSAGAALLDNGDLIDLRAGLNPTDALTVFFDIGSVDPGKGDNEFGYQLGFLYNLPLNLNVPLALRMAYYNVDDLREADGKGSSQGALVTGVFGGRLETLAPDSKAYGQLGLDFRENKFGGDSDTLVSPALSLGFMHGITPNTWLYFELAHIDDFIWGGGIRWTF